MKKKTGILCLILLMAISGCTAPGVSPEGTQNAGLRRFEGSFLDVFDTVTQVVLYETDQQTAEQRVAHIRKELTDYHRLFDIYNAYEGVNNLYTVNESAGVAPVRVDSRLISLILYAKQAYTLTGGRMNIAMGSVLSIWHAYREAGIDNPAHASLPPMEELIEAAAHCDIDDVIVDESAGTIYLADPAMRLDVGAIAKGYAAARVIEAMRSEGAVSLLLSVGGNVCGIGVRGDGNQWKVGVQSPDMQNYLCYVGVGNQSLVTSGDYQRYYTVDGKRYHHIIDPDTHMPATHHASVSVLTADSGLADALSTALFILPLSEGQRLVESLEGVEAAWLDAAGNMVYSSGFSEFVIEDTAK